MCTDPGQRATIPGAPFYVFFFRASIVVILLGAMLAAGTVSVFAASFALTRARWDASRAEITVEGTGLAGASVAIVNADNGAAIGSARVASDGKWRVKKTLSASPCRVRATSNGVSLQASVENAPASCTSTKSLASLKISGTNSVLEGGAASYTATAAYSDASTKVVTASATWTENSAYASISGGTLATAQVAGSQTVTVSASYSEGGVTKTATITVTIRDTTLAFTKAQWDASRAELSVEGTGRPSAAVAVADAASSAAIGSAAVASDGRWKLKKVLSASPCRVRAAADGLVVERAVTNAPSNCSTTSLTLSSLAITGPVSVNENATAAYAATAIYSDGSTATVTTGASWSENSSFATINAGVLTTSSVTSNQPVTVGASYTSGAITKTASVAVTILDLTMTGSHAGRFTTYEGTRTCLTCHLNEAVAMHQSVHYQWQGDATESVGLNSTTAGKMGGINDFCIYPDINWLGKLTNVNGQQVDGGCARCHTGLGLKPTPDPSTAQLENIDCLMCHSKNYKRTLALVNGTYQFVPDTANMTVSVFQAAVDLTRPGNAQCLNCHAKSGGGDNLKRGDLEVAHSNPSASLDVHMAPTSAGGAGLTCTSCHTATGHRIAGRGIDLRERDTPTVVACANCHGSLPHSTTDLNKHTTRLNCTVCHIPSFARQAPTDMVRDWSKPGVLNPATGLFEPAMVMASHVTPSYGFFNGRSQFYQFGDPAVAGPNGRILMAGPLGKIQDAGAKIQAMKSHDGVQPIDPVTKRLLPLKMGIFYQSGDVATAVAQGAAAVGWPYSGHQFAATERKLGLYHQVAPKASAVACNSCHEGGTRMDFAALGYTPLSTRNGKPLCSSCHGAKTGSFYTVHNKHVTDKKLDCSNCHTFSKAL